MAQTNGYFTGVEYEVFNEQVLTTAFHDIQHRIKELNVRNDDVWLCCYPKTGKFFKYE